MASRVISSVLLQGEKMKAIEVLLVMFVLLMPVLLHAEECNELKPSFVVAGVEKWQGQSAAEIYRQQKKLTAGAVAEDDDQGIALKSLILPYAQKGTLIVYACGDKSHTFDVSELVSDNPQKPDYSLTLSKKNFFKLVAANDPKPMLKKVYQLKLIP